MTLIDDVRKGHYDEYVNRVAEYEGIEVEKLAKLIAHGYVVIPRNVNREIEPRAIGMFVSTKINANIGTSIDYVSIDEEIKKAEVAQKYGADAVMDLSTGGNLDEIRRKLIKVCNVPFGTVPIYQAARESKVVVEMEEDDFFKVVEKQAKDGVDFMTIHAGVNRVTVDRLRKSKRLLGVVSRGGAIIMGWMIHNELENPYYKDFDYLLEILRE
ncbi:phosphomethylpyrimidine synthase, partial [Archaeoglobales archaeon]